MIKRATKKDFSEIKSMISREFPYKTFTPENLIARFETPGVVILKKTHNRNLAGFIDFEVKENTGFINAVSVKGTYRRRGFGKELIEFALGVMRHNNIAQARLLVKKGNEKAKKLYNSAGFLFEDYHDRKIDGSTVEVWGKNLFEDDMDYLN